MDTESFGTMNLWIRLWQDGIALFLGLRPMQSTFIKPTPAAVPAVAHRIRLVARLRVAVDQLRGSEHYESAAAVAEALEVVLAIPYGKDINAALYPPNTDFSSRK
jgi:hypothetical protein